MADYLGLGGGWQSSCLLLMSCDGLVSKLSGAIFADTQGEMPETYAYLDFLAEKCGRAGIPLIRATGGNLRSDVYARAGKGNQPSMPVRVRDEAGKLQRVNGYTCSFDYKRRVVTREIRRLCGGRGAWKTAANVTHWMGFSMDEMSRMKTEDECRCGHKRTATVSRRSDRLMGHDGPCRQCGCGRFDRWRTMAFPLVTDMQMTRNDCRRWIVDHGYPAPPRSACYFCPNHGNAHWRDLRDNNPTEWANTVELDEFVRHGMNGLRGEAFIHQSGVPLAQADLRSRVQQLDEDHGITPLFVDEDMDCAAGVCFT